eukprot:gene21695-21649_t
MKPYALRSAIQAGLSALLPALFVALAPAHAAETITSAEQLYQTHCAACHGSAMQGAIGPTLGAHKWLHGAPTKANLVKVITRGVPEKDMPSWGKTLSAAQIEQLAGYIA